MKRLIAVSAFIALFGGISFLYAQQQPERDIITSLSDSITNVDANRSGNIMVEINDPALETSKGNRGNQVQVNIRGTAPAGIDASATDIWGTDTTTWTMPTAARTHTITSTSSFDDGDSAGSGTRTIKITGLTDWDAGEVSEILTMDGTTGTTTALSYVIINDMEVVTYGTSTVGPNQGQITATATTDSTISSIMLVGEGRAHSTIYGIPSTEIAYINNWYGSVNKASGAAAHINFTLMANEYPGTATSFISKDTRGLQSTGNSSDKWSYNPPLVIDSAYGTVLKVSGLGSAANVDGSAGYDLIRADRPSVQTILTQDGREILTQYGREIIRE
jgi:hypothetical protein